jgi:hypothetical protein
MNSLDLVSSATIKDRKEYKIQKLLLGDIYFNFLETKKKIYNFSRIIDN